MSQLQEKQNLKACQTRRRAAAEELLYGLRTRVVEV
jgi:hypothetical protein